MKNSDEMYNKERKTPPIRFKPCLNTLNIIWKPYFLIVGRTHGYRDLKQAKYGKFKTNIGNHRSHTIPGAYICPRSTPVIINGHNH
jgi:hypothetical protein